MNLRDTGQKSSSVAFAHIPVMTGTGRHRVPLVTASTLHVKEDHSNGTAGEPQAHATSAPTPSAGLAGH